MSRRTLSTVLMALAVLAVPVAAFQARPAPPSVSSDEQQAEKKPAEIKSDLYTLDTCPISGQKLGVMGDAAVKIIDGREVRFCCPACIEPFEKDKEKHFAELDKKMIEQQLPYYPLDTCVVMGDPLVLDGEDIAIDYIYKNRLVRFCCKMCIRDFNAEPKKYLDKLDAAVLEKQRDHYPMSTCLVSGRELGSMGDPVERVYGNRLVRFCCENCVATFEKEPVEYVEKLNTAWKAMHEKHGEASHDQHDDQHHDHAH